MTNTNRPLIREHNQATGEILDRPMNDEEWATHQEELVKFTADKTAKEQKEAARIAILEKLGITADEAKILLA